MKSPNKYDFLVEKMYEDFLVPRGTTEEAVMKNLIPALKHKTLSSKKVHY
jgi:hypothetical protein